MNVQKKGEKISEADCEKKARRMVSEAKVHEQLSLITRRPHPPQRQLLK